jgi:predicted nuclease of restriction endonuclease-like (RecB) superfamily
MERNFYEKQCLLENWSVRELKRQVDSGLFYRIALNRDKKGIINLCKKGNIISNARDLVKDPYVLEFLDLPEHYSEKELENRLVSNLAKLMLEFGRGFSFIARQFRISLDGEHYYVDLVFYHKILKCFVLIDLKIGRVTASDVGQMNMYLNYFKNEENSIDDTAPIGIILSAHKGRANVRYALGGISNNLFVSRYKTYLPDRKELENRLREILCA